MLSCVLFVSRLCEHPVLMQTIHIADPRILSWGTETGTDSEYEHSIGLKRQ